MKTVYVDLPLSLDMSAAKSQAGALVRRARETRESRRRAVLGALLGTSALIAARISTTYAGTSPAQESVSRYLDEARAVVSRGSDYYAARTAAREDLYASSALAVGRAGITAATGDVYRATYRLRKQEATGLAEFRADPRFRGPGVAETIEAGLTGYLRLVGESVTYLVGRLFGAG